MYWTSQTNLNNVRPTLGSTSPSTTTSLTSPSFWDSYRLPSLSTDPLEDNNITDNNYLGSLLDLSGNSGFSFLDKRVLANRPNTSTLQNRLFNDPAGNAGPTTRTVEGQGIFTDIDANQVWGGGENYDPASSVWNGWMSAQDSMQNPTIPTTYGINRTPTDRGDQDFQNALTMADYTDTPLTPDEESAYFQNAKYGT